MARVAERLAAVASGIGVHDRLQWAQCPVSRGEALRNADAPMPELIQWVRAGLTAGRCMRTAQSERIARGEALAHVAYETGIGPDKVLEMLTWAELPELD